MTTAAHREILTSESVRRYLQSQNTRQVLGSSAVHDFYGLYTFTHSRIHDETINSQARTTTTKKNHTHNYNSTPNTTHRTHWTWYTTTSYFVVSALSAFLCWKAMRKVGTGGPMQSITTIPSAAPTATSSRPALPVALRWLQLSLWSSACLGSLIVVAIFWGALVRRASVGSIYTLSKDIILPSIFLEQMGRFRLGREKGGTLEKSRKVK